MIKQRITLTEIPEVKYICYMRSHNSTVKICIFERSNEKNHFSKSKIYFHKTRTAQILGHIGLQNMKVGVNRILGDLPQYFKFVRWMLISSLKLQPFRGWMLKRSVKQRELLLQFVAVTVKNRIRVATKSKVKPV